MWIAVLQELPASGGRTHAMKRTIWWLALPLHPLLDPRQPCRILQQAGATWPAPQLAHKTSHTSPTRRTTVRRASRRAPTVHMRAHAFQRLSPEWPRPLSATCAHRHLDPLSLPTEMDTTGVAGARGVDWAPSQVSCANSACGWFRRAGARTCNRCSQPTPARPPDSIMGPLGVEAASRPTPCCTSPELRTVHDCHRFAVLERAPWRMKAAPSCSWRGHSGGG